MNIPPAALVTQYERANIAWPFVHDIERRYDLPAFLLFAVGSRETNLTDEIGDGGHGRGVWQLDDRSHQIPDPFPVELQAEMAGQMLGALIAAYAGSVTPAVAAYNAGVGGVARVLAGGLPADMATTGHDYAADVLDRRRFLEITFPRPQEADMPPSPNEPMAILTNPAGPGSYVLTADGGIITKDGATFPGGMPPYVALASDGNTYYFPAANGAMNYLGLDAADRQGSRYFKSFAWTRTSAAA